MDHLADVPWIAAHYARGARVYGSRTTAHILAAVPEVEGRVTPLDQTAAATPYALGRWVDAAPGLRFMPVVSSHAPHLRIGERAISWFGGRRHDDMASLPRTAAGYRVGEVVYAFLIEFLDPSGHPFARVYVNDAAAAAPDGELPVERVGTVDLAFLTVPGFDLVEGYPGHLLDRLRPRRTVLIHWEDFFQATDRPLRPVPLVLDRQRIARFRDRVDRRDDIPDNEAPAVVNARHISGPLGPRSVLPAPGEVMVFDLGAAADGHP